MCVSYEALPQNKAFAIRPFQLILYGTICNVCVCLCVCDWGGGGGLRAKGYSIQEAGCQRF